MLIEQHLGVVVGQDQQTGPFALIGDPELLRQVGGGSMRSGSGAPNRGGTPPRFGLHTMRRCDGSLSTAVTSPMRSGRASAFTSKKSGS